MNPSLILILALPLILLAALWFVHRSRAARGLRLVLGNLLVLGFLASLLLVGGEAYYRYVYDETDGFAIGLTSKRWFDRYYRFNNRGIRDSVDYADRLRADTTRITFLGDSYTNGHGIKDVEDRFANLLRSAHDEWEIHFIGGDGNDTGDLLESLERWVSRGYQLDKLVYVYCLNDISDLIPEWQATAQELFSERPGIPFSGSFFLNTLYYRYKVRNDAALYGYFDRVAAAYENQHWPVHARRLETLIERVARSGGELMVVTFPFFERMDSPEYRAIHDKLGAFWNERQVPHLDLTESFRALPIEEIIVNRQDTHANEYGHRVAADRIEEFLTRQLGSRESSDEDNDRD